MTSSTHTKLTDTPGRQPLSHLDACTSCTSPLVSLRHLLLSSNNLYNKTSEKLRELCERRLPLIALTSFCVQIPTDTALAGSRRFLSTWVFDWPTQKHSA